jgi:hypothetical protein
MQHTPTTLNIAVVAPVPSATVSTAAIEGRRATSRAVFAVWIALAIA